MSKKFLLPDLGEGLPDATIVEWYVKEGDVIRLDENLVSMETAKAVVDVPSPVSGKVIAMWMPIMLFFFMTFEHSIVNMFLFPSGLLLGGKFTVMDYLIWNEIPTVVGNLVGGLAFTGLTLYATHVKTAPKRAAGRIAA